MCRLVNKSAEFLHFNIHFLNLSCMINTREHHLNWIKLEHTLLYIEPSKICNASTLNQTFTHLLSLTNTLS